MFQCIDLQPKFFDPSNRFQRMEKYLEQKKFNEHKNNITI